MIESKQPQLGTTSFDAVVCAFGILHCADPDKAMAEAYCVLRPDGRYAFTVWMSPDRHDFFAIVLKAIEIHAAKNPV